MPKKPTRSKQEKRDVRLRLCIGLCITIAVMALYVLSPPLLKQADRQVYDTFLQISAEKDRKAGKTPSPTPALIDIDEKSLSLYGQWPWPRHLLARLIKNLTEGGVAAIGLDILLSERDRTSPVELQEALRRSFGVDVRFEGLPKALTDNDALLAAMMVQAPVVNGFYLHFIASTAVPLPEDVGSSMGVVMQAHPNAVPAQKTILQAHGATLPLPDLRISAPLGSINVAPDPDGIVRAVPLVTQAGGKIFPSLALRSLMRGLGINTLVLRSGPDGLQALRFGSYEVPVTPQGLFHVLFRGPRHTYPYFSAADVLDGKISPEELQGRVCIVGTSSPGLLDIRATPLDPVFPGMEVHAAVIDGILSKRFMQQPAWIPGAQVLGVAFVGLVASLAFSLAAPLIYLPIGLALCIGSIGATWHFFVQGFFFSPLYVLITIMLTAVSLLGVRFWQEMRQKRLLRQAFSRYLSPDMVDRVADRDVDIFAGEEREVTLMFTDIRSFTTLSEGLRPEQVVSILNRYFTPMTSIIRNSQGTVDKFIGDAIMAFWNAPTDVPGHPCHGVRSALAMQEALATLNVEIEENFGLRLSMGVGVHTGQVYVGNMGTSELLDYTCIGDTVNLASRLEGLCPVYGVNVVVSGNCAQQCCALDPGFHLFDEGMVAGLESCTEKDIIFFPLDSIKVKGKHKAVEIFTPLPHNKADLDFLAAFSRARAEYTHGNFAVAAQGFTSLLAAKPEHALTAVYAERCASLQEAPPPQWDGVWTFTKK